MFLGAVAQKRPKSLASARRLLAAMQAGLPVWVSLAAWLLPRLSDDLCRQALAGLHQPPASQNKHEPWCQSSTAGHNCGGHAQTTLAYPGIAGCLSTAWLVVAVQHPATCATCIGKGMIASLILSTVHTPDNLQHAA